MSRARGGDGISRTAQGDEAGALERIPSKPRDPPPASAETPDSAKTLPRPPPEPGKDAPGSDHTNGTKKEG